VSRIVSVRIHGTVDYEGEIPKKEIHDWVNTCPFPWVGVSVEMEKRMKHPTQKGSSFERQFCRALSLWVSKGVDENIYWRTSGSGGWATRKRAKIQLGDITCYPEKVELGGWLLELAVFELKCRDIAIGELFTKPFMFMEELIHKLKCSEEATRIPLVVMKSEGAMLTLSLTRLVETLGVRFYNFDNTFALFDFREVFTKIDPMHARVAWTLI
jgi:hypothetical protein